MKQKLWTAIERYRTAGGSAEHHAFKADLDALIDQILNERVVWKAQDMSREVMQQALNALEGLFGVPDHLMGGGGGVSVWRLGGSAPVLDAIAALRVWLAKPEPEPVEFTREMISAAHGVTLERGDIVLSANLLERIYRAMRAKERP